MNRSDEMGEIDEFQLCLVVTFVFLGPDPWLVSQILWLLLVFGFYLTTPDYRVVQEGIGGRAL